MMAVSILPVRDSFLQFAEELTMVGVAAKTLFSGDIKGAYQIGQNISQSHAESLKPKAKQVSKTPVMTDDLELASVTEEKKKQDKKLFDEELYDLQETSRLEASRDKTLFDRMMRDAEFNRDEKNRILALEKETALKNREIIMRGMEASGTILDKARASAERLGNFNLVNQIDRERSKQQRETDVSLLQGLGARPDSFGGRTNEQISALTQTEGNLQRSQNSELLKSFTDMQGLVNRISAQIDKRLGVPILRSAN
jgi:phosphatidate phosphatase PAH1